MGEDRGAVRPVDLGARRHVPFKVIGMQFHQAGRDVIPLHVPRALWHGGAGIDIGDHPICNADRAGFDPIAQNQTGIGENRLLGHGFIF